MNLIKQTISTIKKLYLLLLSFCLYNITHAQKIVKATVISVPLSMTTTFSESCEAFVIDFKNLKKTGEVQSADLAKLSALLKKQYSKLKNPINVRGKLILSYDNSQTKQFCFDEFGKFMFKTKQVENKPLFNFLLKRKLIGY